MLECVFLVCKLKSRLTAENKKYQGEIFLKMSKIKLNARDSQRKDSRIFFEQKRRLRVDDPKLFGPGVLC
jgi:hypothetical protein